MQLAPPKQKRVRVTFVDPDAGSNKSFTLYGVTLPQAVEQALGKKAAEQVGRSNGRGRPRRDRVA